MAEVQKTRGSITLRVVQWVGAGQRVIGRSDIIISKSFVEWHTPVTSIDPTDYAGL